MNIFLIDDYLRTIKNSSRRQKIIREVGLSREKRDAYEMKHQLPNGAVELAMMAEDERINRISELYIKKLNAAEEPAEKKSILDEIVSISYSLHTVYPDSIRFLNRYSAMSERVRNDFVGDYEFQNHYKLSQLTFDAGNPDNPGVANINTELNINLALNVNAAVNNKVVATVVVFVALGVLVFGALAIALYGQKEIS